MKTMDKEQFLQGLKDSLILWDVERMFHTRLSDAVLEDLTSLGIESADKDLTTRKGCEVVTQLIESNREKMDAALYSDCKAELREIRDDMKWLASKTGKCVMAIERWLVTARQKAKESFPYNEIVMGRDMMEKPDNLVVGIVAETREECFTIQDTIESWYPPVEPDYKVYIISEQR